METQINIVQGGAVHEGAKQASAPTLWKPPSDHMAEEHRPAESTAGAEIISNLDRRRGFDGLPQQIDGVDWLILVKVKTAIGQDLKPRVRQPRIKNIEGARDGSDVGWSKDDRYSFSFFHSENYFACLSNLRA